MRPLNTEAWEESDGDRMTEEETMASVPFEKTYASMSGSEAKDLRAGGTSGNVPRESYAFIRFSISSSESETPNSSKACLRDAFVMSENDLYNAVPWLEEVVKVGLGPTHGIHSPCVFELETTP